MLQLGRRKREMRRILAGVKEIRCLTNARDARYCTLFFMRGVATSAAQDYALQFPQTRHGT
jgi:hypothetical protein